MKSLEDRPTSETTCRSPLMDRLGRERGVMAAVRAAITAIDLESVLSIGAIVLGVLLYKAARTSMEIPIGNIQNIPAVSSVSR